MKTQYILYDNDSLGLSKKIVLHFIFGVLK